MDREEQRLELATESVKQQITLATAIIGATLAFSGQLSGARQGAIWDLLPVAFVPLAVSIVCGVLTLMSLAFHLGKDGDPLATKDVRVLGALQNAVFMVSVLLMVGIIAWV